MKFRAAATWLLFAPAVLAQNVPAPATITFTFDNSALQPSHYTMVVHEDGSGRYRSEAGHSTLDRPAMGDASASPGSMSGSMSGSTSRSMQPSQGSDRDMTLADPLRKQLFAAARKDHLFATECKAKQGNLAFTGNKTFSYAGPEGSGSCTFNYSRDQQLQQIANGLIAVATTLEEGPRLELLLVHDKLGLDAEVALLSDEQADGRALDLENIAPVLQAIASSEEVMNHTRSRATALLAKVPAH